MAVAGFAGRQVLRVAPNVAQKMSEVLKTMSSESSGILVKSFNILTLILVYVFIQNFIMSIVGQ